VGSSAGEQEGNPEIHWTRIAACAGRCQTSAFRKGFD